MKEKTKYRRKEFGIVLRKSEVRRLVEILSQGTSEVTVETDGQEFDNVDEYFQIGTPRSLLTIKRKEPNSQIGFSYPATLVLWMREDSDTATALFSRLETYLREIRPFGWLTRILRWMFWPTIGLLFGTWLQPIQFDFFARHHLTKGIVFSIVGFELLALLITLGIPIYWRLAEKKPVRFRHDKGERPIDWGHALFECTKAIPAGVIIWLLARYFAK